MYDPLQRVVDVQHVPPDKLEVAISCGRRYHSIMATLEPEYTMLAGMYRKVHQCYPYLGLDQNNQQQTVQRGGQAGTAGLHLSDADRSRSQLQHQDKPFISTEAAASATATALAKRKIFPPLSFAHHNSYCDLDQVPALTIEYDQPYGYPTDPSELTSKYD